jgi:hypothetical protein
MRSQVRFRALVVGLLPAGSEVLDVKNILLPSACELVSNEIMFGNNDGPDFAIQKTLDTVLPGFIETDTIDVLQ